ncbi:MAG: PSD1 and planctomycete cytochrome C domain-containing protein, partial [Verrucomicrobiota bacterium]|nr:PSD1 and planctomycete cytochrome C domain-containing protein [Verrucomicrobiota bacterium]
MKTRIQILLALLAALVVTAPARAAEPLRYNRNVRPILSDNCFACHGPDKNKRDSGLRLDLREEAIHPAESGDTAIVPGKPEQSQLIARIFSEDRDEKMPPPKAHKILTPQQKETLKRWIAEGAAYEMHWSFTPLTPVELPALKASGWPRSGLDRFILARLEKEGLSPSPEADKATLIRRLSLDLIGLPPTPAQVEAFIADDSPHACEKVVDQLLGSRHYGERMAVDWLDAARFADSNGYQVDRDREMFAWREWVIRAFNENKPFDQFTVEQLAGDLLPSATLDQRIATGFHRNHMINEEGGVIAEEFLAEYAADRVETTATVWLGQTLNCARCHDHKFDPFTQRDFYSLKAFFHNVPEKGKGDASGNIRLSNPPFQKLPAPELEAKIAALKKELAAADQERARLAEQAVATLDELARRLAATSIAWTSAEIVRASGGVEEPVVDAANRAVRIAPQEEALSVTVTTHLPPQRVTALRLECATADGATSLGWSELTVTRTAGRKKQPLKLRAAEAGRALAAKEIAKVLDRDRRTAAKMVVAPDRSAEAVFELENALTSSDAEPIELEVVLSAEGAGVSTEWRISATDADAELLAPASVIVIAKKDPARRTAAERKQLATFAASRESAQQQLSDRIASLTKELTIAEGEIPTTLVMEEMAEPRPTFILLRGAYDKPGEPVTPNTPAALPAMAVDLPRNRLGLARWLVDPRNPLPARVTVNRLWQAVFGTGLVKTSEDFGAQGESPSHPELLDWLAGEFIRGGWDVKAMMRLLVTSATYRQSSRLAPALCERDPDNRLLARGARFRLPAEFVRDQALAVSGLLAPRIGGPSVRPYHPPGLYEQVVATRFASGYVQGKGDELHRRSLYTYWKRSVPPPAMLAFDAPFREACTLRRARTNTPLQALNLMNDPTYVEAARFLAQRMMREGGATAEARLTRGFHLILARS